MIGQYLSNTNEKATVYFGTKQCHNVFSPPKLMAVPCNSQSHDNGRNQGKLYIPQAI